MRFALVLLSTLLLAQPANLRAQDDSGRLPRLEVAEDRRFLVTESNQPFFWLGDTAWELFHRLDREEADRYLRNRSELGFTVVQAVALAEIGGLRVPNPYGYTPLVNNDPSQPNDDYFRHVDWIVKRANELGIYIGLLPTWGDKWHSKPGESTGIFTPDNAEAYGQWLGQRYRTSGVIWILGGDRSIDTDRHRTIIRAMARGLRHGDGGAHLMTFHPSGYRSSSRWFHNEDWLDFNMTQTGHCTDIDSAIRFVKDDYARTPIKPTFDGEPRYEDIKKCFYKENPGPRFTAREIREIAYRQLFSGAFGHTYGHNSIWQMFDGTNGHCSPSPTTWSQALDAPGGTQMRYVASLMRSRPILGRIPDQSLVAGGSAAATRGDGYAFVYLRSGKTVEINLGKISGGQVKAWWYNPRNGKATEIGQFENQGRRAMAPSGPEKNLDWVLVLDDVDKHYPSPGGEKLQP